MAATPAVIAEIRLNTRSELENAHT
ncbi:ORFS350W [Human betaherpesvirus 5]|nr:ORFS350W [Human betaherpesvirus 5]QHX40719.1 ORFS350W [Human betaherpesvirus 5]